MGCFREMRFDKISDGWLDYSTVRSGLVAGKACISTFLDSDLPFWLSSSYPAPEITPNLSNRSSVVVSPFTCLELQGPRKMI